MVKQDALIAVSGGFDPVHGGHIDYLEGAATYGRLIVILNTDTWLIRKKGFCFMKWEERKRVLMALECVHDVYMAHDDDGTVCEDLSHFGTLDYFGKGGDRTRYNTPEDRLCNDLGIKVIYGLGGRKTQSSSQLVKNVQTH